MNALVLADSHFVGEAVIACLRDRHVRVTIIATEACSALNSDRYCDWFIPVSSCDLAESQELVLALIDNAAKKLRIDVVIPAGTQSTYFLAHHGPNLAHAKSIPMSDAALLRRLSDKAEFASLLELLNIPHPRTLIAHCPETLNAAEIRVPIVVKAAVGEGGIGVEPLLTGDQLEEALPRLTERDDFPLLVQEFIPGKDIDLSVLAVKGEIVAWTVQRNFLMEDLTFTTHAEVLELGRKIIAHTEYTGIAHIDMREDERDGSIKVIEFNTRFWFTVYASAVAGVNFVDLAARMALSKPLPEIQYRHVRVRKSNDRVWR